MPTFYEKLAQRWEQTKSMVCVGLDTDIRKLPPAIQKGPQPLFNYNRLIIDATHEHVCCYKPQIAYYAAQGAEKELEMTFDYLNTNYPEIPHILDAKRGDIGSTAEMYAKEAFERYGADSVTVNPYLGGDTLEPFLRFKEKGIIILCKTSNPGAGEFQELETDGRSVYQRVAYAAQHQWNTNNNILLVVGATYPNEIKVVRAIAPDIPFLVPGVGAQGGDPQAVVRAGLMANGYGLVVNSSRGIIYAGNHDNFTEMAQQRALELKQALNQSK